MIRKILRILKWVLIALIVLIIVGAIWQRDNLMRFREGGLRNYETSAPALPNDLKRPAILVFSKTNGFRHAEAIDAANALFKQMAAAKGWSIYNTENGATFTPANLARFDAVVFNNVSGDPFNPDQQKAFQAFLDQGGGFVGIHGSGGDFGYLWKWYVNDLIGAQFISHTMKPQFQTALTRVEDKNHPATAALPDSWRHEEELYSFDASVRAKGYHVLVNVDEASYVPIAQFGKDIRMGKDHPMVWWHCVGKGRALYSAFGHLPQAYSEPEYRQLLTGAVEWAARQAGEGCDAPK